MEATEQILARARERAQRSNLPYAGALLSAEAYALMQFLPGARLVDVRTRAELEWVGRVPGSAAIEWNTWPGAQRNPTFMAEFAALVAGNEHDIVMFLCRSGVRSHHAALAVTEAGHGNAYNILQGFEGDKDASGQRNRLGGWRFTGLPWTQG